MATAARGLYQRQHFESQIPASAAANDFVPNDADTGFEICNTRASVGGGGVKNDSCFENSYINRDGHPRRRGPSFLRVHQTSHISAREQAAEQVQLISALSNVFCDLHGVVPGAHEETSPLCCGNELYLDRNFEWPLPATRRAFALESYLDIFDALRLARAGYGRSAAPTPVSPAVATSEAVLRLYALMWASRPLASGPAPLDGAARLQRTRQALTHVKLRLRTWYADSLDSIPPARLMQQTLATFDLFSFRDRAEVPEALWQETWVQITRLALLLSLDELEALVFDETVSRATGDGETGGMDVGVALLRRLFAEGAFHGLSAEATHEAARRNLIALFSHDSSLHASFIAAQQQSVFGGAISVFAARSGAEIDRLCHFAFPAMWRASFVLGLFWRTFEDDSSVASLDELVANELDEVGDMVAILFADWINGSGTVARSATVPDAIYFAQLANNLSGFAAALLRAKLPIAPFLFDLFLMDHGVVGEHAYLLEACELASGEQAGSDSAWSVTAEVQPAPHLRCALRWRAALEVRLAAIACRAARLGASVSRNRFSFAPAQVHGNSSLDAGSLETLVCARFHCDRTAKKVVAAVARFCEDVFQARSVDATLAVMRLIDFAIGEVDLSIAIEVTAFLAGKLEASLHEVHEKVADSVDKSAADEQLSTKPLSACRSVLEPPLLLLAARNVLATLLRSDAQRLTDLQANGASGPVEALSTQSLEFGVWRTALHQSGSTCLSRVRGSSGGNGGCGFSTDLASALMSASAADLWIDPNAESLGSLLLGCRYTCATLAGALLVNLHACRSTASARHVALADPALPALAARILTSVASERELINLPDCVAANLLDVVLPALRETGGEHPRPALPPGDLDRFAAWWTWFRAAVMKLRDAAETPTTGRWPSLTPAAMRDVSALLVGGAVAREMGDADEEYLDGSSSDASSDNNVVQTPLPSDGAVTGAPASPIIDWLLAVYGGELAVR